MSTAPASSTRRGKIARLPHAIREQLNHRLLDNQAGTQVLPWLNALPEVKAVLAEHFDGEPINDANLTAWRQGGWLDWRHNNEKVEHLKHLSEYSLSLVKSSGLNLADGAAAIAAGNLLARIETSEPEELESMIKAIDTLRAGDHSRERLKLDSRKVELKEQQLDLDERKLRMVSTEKFMKFAATPEAQAILHSDKSRSVKMAEIQALLWGEEDEAEA